MDLLRRGRLRRRARAERPGRYRRVAAGRVLVGVLAGAVLAAPAASAHVTVNPREAAKGGYAALAFRVPNERDDAGTVELRVSFEEAVFPAVRVKPKTGWTYEVEMTPLDEPIPAEGEQEEITEAVSTITWTGSVIQPGEFEEFEVSLGPLPEDVDELMFPAIQTYEPVGGAEGEVVEWIEEPPAEGGEEPERPAPLLTLVEEEEEGGAAAEEDAAGMSVENTASQDDVDSANTLAIVGLLVGLLGVATGAVALVQGRRRVAAATASTSAATPTSTGTSGNASDTSDTTPEESSS